MMYIHVESCGFAGDASMDIDIKQFAEFCVDLSKLYDTLKGSARIQEPFGYRQFIEFTTDKLGHIYISGMIRSESEFVHALQFENSVDQTALKDFSKELTDAYAHYRK